MQNRSVSKPRPLHLPGDVPEVLDWPARADALDFGHVAGFRFPA